MRRVAYKFRIYPDSVQKALIRRTFGCVRFVWNRMLADAKESYTETKKFSYLTPAGYKPEYPFLKKVDSLALCNAQMHLKTAFSRFFEDRKDKKKKRKIGFPVFKKRKTARKSYSTNCIHGNTIRIAEGKLRLPKLGLVRTVFHRRVNGRIKSATISETPSGKFYVSILTEQLDLQNPEIDPNSVVGLDMSFSSFYVDHTGMKPKYLRWFRKMEKKLARAQRKFHRRQKGSVGRERQRVAVAVIHEKIRNQRRDFLHRTVHDLLSRYDVVIVEDINFAAMAKRGKRRRFGKSVMDLGFGTFRILLEQKAESLGKIVVRADKWFPSSQLCSHCEYQNKGTKDLSVRQWTCSGCGAQHDRDRNAAQNLVNYYLERQSTRQSTGAALGIYADGDSSSTRNPRVPSKSGRGTRKSCETVDLTSPSL